MIIDVSYRSSTDGKLCLDVINIPDTELNAVSLLELKQLVADRNPDGYDINQVRISMGFKI